MPSFCRHNRFIERCPICGDSLPDSQAGEGSRSRGSAGTGAKRRTAGSSRSGSGASGARSASRPGNHGTRAETERLRVRREARAQDDGYRNALLPGLHASSDADRLADELAFASGRLTQLRSAPADLYAEIRTVAREGALERACWMCFLTVYLSPLQDADPFAGVRVALGRGDMPSLEGIPLGPRTSHAPERGDETLRAYRHWVQRAAGAHDGAPGRRLPGRAELDAAAPVRARLRTAGAPRLRAHGALQAARHDRSPGAVRAGGRFAAYRGRARRRTREDLTTVAAKRVFEIGEPIYLERRARALADALTVELAALDLAFANWSAPERATLGLGSQGARR